MRSHSVPAEILTDNGKVFNRFGRGPRVVLFDRICVENGIKHILTTPRSPTTTGKVERWHKTMRTEFLNGKIFDTVFPDLQRTPVCPPVREVSAQVERSSTLLMYS